jgi:xanthine dehydrogenase YagT iron-sulfur-binding subunit
MTNGNDLFDEPEEPAQQSSERPREAQAQGRGSFLRQSLGRRQFLRGAGAAAVAGAVVGAGATAGVAVLVSDGEDTASGVAERDGMTLGAPPGRAISQAVIKLNVNGVDRWVSVDAYESLAEVLRRKLGLTGTKIGCDRSECSACTVILDGVAVNSCSQLAIREDGKSVVTIEGLEQGTELSPMQQGFLDNMGLQCGFCTPGQIMQATALLEHNPQPSDDDILRAMSGNLCKCSAYPNIMAAIKQASGSGAA